MFSAYDNTKSAYSVITEAPWEDFLAYNTTMSAYFDDHTWGTMTWSLSIPYHLVNRCHWSSSSYQTLEIFLSAIRYHMSFCQAVRWHRFLSELSDVRHPYPTCHTPSILLPAVRCQASSSQLSDVRHPPPSCQMTCILLPAVRWHVSSS